MNETLPTDNKTKITPRSKKERAFWLFMAIVVGVGLLLVFAGILAAVVLQGNPIN